MFCTPNLARSFGLALQTPRPNLALKRRFWGCSMNSRTPRSDPVKRTRMGWCLFVNGRLAYAVGSQAYCIAVANELRKGGAA